LSDDVLRTLGRYEIQGEIGRGTMGVVYKALDPALGRAVALKTVHLAFSVPEAERANYEERFLSEARIAAALSHPGIVVVHDVGRDPESGTLYIALEFLRGRTLDELAVHPMDWREALRITGAVAEGLDHAHSHGVVHRDVKPANIMVLASGEPKIMDFGIAKVPASNLTTAGEFFGTPSYMAPEQAQGESVDARSDIFSLGCVLYLLLTGKRAFDGPNVPAILSKITHKDPPAPSSLVAGLPAGVDAVVSRALAKDPNERYPDARSFAEDLNDVRTGREPQNLRGWQPPPPAQGTLVSSGPWPKRETEPLSSRPAPPPTGTTALAKDRRGVLVVAAVAALAVLLGVVALFRAPAPHTASTSEAPVSERTPEPGETPEPTPASSGFKFPFFGKKDPAQLEVVFEHSIRSGKLKVWMDDDVDPVIDEPLESVTVRKILSVRIRKGTLKKMVEVAPGEHVVRVEVEGDGEVKSRRIRGTFESGSKRRLEINRESIPFLKKDLSLDWS
jgi:serine/threonine protein kinase